MMFARPRGGAILSLALAIAWVGCSNDTPPNTPGPPAGDAPINLEDEYGGYAATDEPAAFGDVELESYAEQDVEVDDAIAEDPMVATLDDDPRASRYALTILWGNLDTRLDGGDDDGGSTTDWSGSLTVNDGAIVLLRVLGFEPGDHVIMPRTDRATLEWESTTAGGHDGLRLLVFDNPAESGEPSDSITFSTDQYTTSLALDDLADLDLTVEVAGGAVHFLATKVDFVTPVRGFVSGRWTWADHDSLGRFSGMWVGARGRPVGWVRGHFGENDEGRAVFFGKYIDRTGNFQGFLRGEVIVHRGTLQSGVGQFDGRWIDSSHDARGIVHGRWASGPDGRGLFEGRWCLGCR